MDTSAYDCMNAVFEAGSACLLTLNVRRLYRDKKLSGVSVIPVAWFSLWGAWNIAYYSKLQQVFSWVAGIAVFIINTTWVTLAIYYKRKKANEKALERHD